MQLRVSVPGDSDFLVYHVLLYINIYINIKKKIKASFLSTARDKTSEKCKTHQKQKNQPNYHTFLVVGFQKETQLHPKMTKQCHVDSMYTSRDHQASSVTKVR